MLQVKLSGSWVDAGAEEVEKLGRNLDVADEGQEASELWETRTLDVVIVYNLGYTSAPLEAFGVWKYSR